MVKKKRKAKSKKKNQNDISYAFPYVSLTFTTTLLFPTTLALTFPFAFIITSAPPPFLRLRAVIFYTKLYFIYKRLFLHSLFFFFLLLMTVSLSSLADQHHQQHPEPEPHSPDYRLLPSLQFRFITIAISVLFCVIAHKLGSHFIFKNHPKKAERFVPFIHAIYGTSAAIFGISTYNPLFIRPVTYCQPIPYWQLLSSISLGYFIWDLWFVFQKNHGFSFVIHAIASIGCYYITTFYSFLHRLSMIALLFEVSTVFLHSYVFCYHFGYPYGCLSLCHFFLPLIMRKKVSENSKSPWFTIARPNPKPWEDWENMVLIS